MVITKGNIIEFFHIKKDYHNSLAEDVHSGVSFIKENILTPEGTGKIENKLQKLLKQYKAAYDKSKRDWIRTQKSFENIWDDELEIESTWIAATCKNPKNDEKPKFGRPLVSNEDAKRTTRKERAKEIVENVQDNPVILLEAVKIVAKNNDNQHLVDIINFIQNDINNLNDYEFSRKTTENGPIMMTAEESARLALDQGLTQNQVQTLRNVGISRRANIWQPVRKIAEAKKACRPENITIDEDGVKVNVPVFDLALHTAQRIINVQEKIIKEIVEEKKLLAVEAELTFAYGGDGSSNQSQYNQGTPSGAHVCDKMLFAMTMTPIQLVTKEKDGKKPTVLWKNPQPQSVRFNRPIFLEFAQENRPYTLRVFGDIENQIEAIKDPFVIPVDETPIFVSCKFERTLIDGKVLNTLTGTSSQQCPVCEIKPKQANNMGNFEKGPDGKAVFDPIDESRLLYGISPLHAIINIFNFLLHMSFKLDTKKWRGSKEDWKLRRTKILKDLYNEFHIVFDQPQAGRAGNSTTGKLCRIAFARPDRLAIILGLDIQLVTNFSIILTVLNCHEEIDYDEFETLCMETYSYFKEGALYHWCTLPPTAHKILAHSKDIIKMLPLPPGYFSEEGAESHNKFYRQFRLFHARKISRMATLMDVFLRAMDLSDPKFSTFGVDFRQSKRKHRPLPLIAQKYIITTYQDETTEQTRITEPYEFLLENVDSGLEECEFDFDEFITHE